VQASLEIDDQDRLSVQYASEVPNGSGLGTSGALNVAFIDTVTRGKHPPEKVAEMAFKLESMLGNRCGRQDQWAAAFGGFQHLRFDTEHVERLPFEPTEELRNWLHRQLVLAYTGSVRISGTLHERIWSRCESEDAEVLSALSRLVGDAQEMARALREGERSGVVEAMREVLRGCDRMDPALHDVYRPVMIPMMALGFAIAWKGVGAAGGGCVAILADDGRADEVRRTCADAGWSAMEWDYDQLGLFRIQQGA